MNCTLDDIDNAKDLIKTVLPSKAIKNERILETLMYQVGQSIIQNIQKVRQIFPEPIFCRSFFYSFFIHLFLEGSLFSIERKRKLCAQMYRAMRT